MTFNMQQLCITNGKIWPIWQLIDKYISNRLISIPYFSFFQWVYCKNFMYPYWWSWSHYIPMHKMWHHCATYQMVKRSAGSMTKFSEVVPEIWTYVFWITPVFGVTPHLCRFTQWANLLMCRVCEIKQVWLKHPIK